MDVPESMKSKLPTPGGLGIDLKSWIGYAGNFSLAVGYTTVFWPEFVLFEGYILRKGFPEESLRGFERQPGITRQSVEWVMNHLHIADIQWGGDDDLSKDKILLLGKVLTEIYQAKLLWQFPGHPCTVEFSIPEDEEDLIQYQLAFWQNGDG